MVRPTSLLFYCLALCSLAFSSGCCCMPCLRMPCIQELDRHYPGSNDCLNGGPCGDPEDVGGRPTGMANCETCGRQSQLNQCGGCSGCGGWFPWTRGFTGGGCGRFYWDEWWSDPPCKCEPCDLQGNYCGTGICRSWRLGLPMPMLSRNCCAANAACCGGSRLSDWANHRTCWNGCLNPCRNACSSGTCHIDSVGYDANCDHCHSGGTLVTPSLSPVPTPMPTPAAPATEAAPDQPVTKLPSQGGAMVARRMPAKAAPAPRAYAAPNATRTRTAAKPVSAPTSMTSTRRR